MRFLFSQHSQHVQEALRPGKREREVSVGATRKRGRHRPSRTTHRQKKSLQAERATKKRKPRRPSRTRHRKKRGHCRPSVRRYMLVCTTACLRARVSQSSYIFKADERAQAAPPSYNKKPLLPSARIQISSHRRSFA